jgi:feruloyl esterase
MSRLNHLIVVASAGVLLVSSGSRSALQASASGDQGDSLTITASSCERLLAVRMPDTTITVAQPITTGSFSPPGAPAAIPNLPPFCRVTATLRPSRDSDIKLEMWLPMSGWNGKYLAVGNGGWAGTITVRDMVPALRLGYATSSTDTGHAGNGGDASFALGHPEKLIDFGYRAVHEMTRTAKALIRELYGSPARYAYWNGCSTGGKQGLAEAQRFPDDFDGIVAGAPANNWTPLMVGLLWTGHATLKETATHLTNESMALLNDAALAACDVLDGVKDGVIENPPACRFDPGILECKGADPTGCLTGAQVDAVRKIYAGPRNPRTGAAIFPGMEPGSERGWGPAAGGPRPFAIPDNHFKYVVFEDPNWNFRTLDFDRDVALAERADRGVLTAMEPDLKRFVSRGGKLLLYHGWNDQLIAPRNSVNYYNAVVQSLGGATKATSSVRLFMAPGMNHCGTGAGPDAFDAVSVIEQWVEQGKAPDRIIASRMTRGKADRTRPLCPYPQIAKYNGSGNTDDAANFSCVAP